MAESEDAVLVRRRFRVVVDIEVTVSDITPDSVDDRLRDRSNYDEIRDDPFYAESSERDRRLLIAFIANQRRLSNHLAFIAAEHATQFVSRDDLLKTQTPLDYEKRLVHEALEDLGPEDATYYLGADAEGYLWENSENFGQAFDAETLSAKMFEIPLEE